MDNKEFWKRLEDLSRSEDAVEQLLGLLDLLKEAYSENLDIICFCVFEKDNPCMARQGFIDAEEGRLLMCYSSMEHAGREPRGLGSCENLLWGSGQMPVRHVIDSMLSRPSVSGIIFNSDDACETMIAPKAMIESLLQEDAGSVFPC